MAVNPFEFVKAINEKKAIQPLTDFNPYLANGSFSYHLDCVLIANEMNAHPNLPVECQFDFLNGSIRKGKRFCPWHKVEDSPYLEAVMEYYNYSRAKALEALQVLTQADLRDIQQKLDKGGAS